RDHAAVVVVDDDGVSGRARVVEVQIVVVGKAWRERGIVADAGTIDVEGDSRAARYEVESGRPSGELNRIDRSIVGALHRRQGAVVGERRRVVGHGRQTPVVVLDPFVGNGRSASGPDAVDGMCDRRQGGQRSK